MLHSQALLLATESKRPTGPVPEAAKHTIVIAPLDSGGDSLQYGDVCVGLVFLPVFFSSTLEQTGCKLMFDWGEGGRQRRRRRAKTVSRRPQDAHLKMLSASC